MTHTRPDIAFSVGVVSRFMRQPSKVHYEGANSILRYILELWTMAFGTQIPIIADCVGTQIMIMKVHWMTDEVFQQTFSL